MPDFEEKAVVGWLTALRPDGAAAEWPPAIRAIETRGGMPAALTALGAAFDETAETDLQTLATALRTAPLRTGLSAVLAQLGAARVLRLLHWLSEANLPDCHAVIAALLQGDDDGAPALRATVNAVTRRATLRRVFALERIAALEAACIATGTEAAR